MTSRAGFVVKNRGQLGRRVSLDTSMLGITSFAIDIDSHMGDALIPATYQLVSRAICLQSRLSPYNEWRFFEHFPTTGGF